MPKSVYLNSQSDLESITRLLRRISGSEVILVVPKSSRLFRYPGKLKALSRVAEELGKNIIIATTSPGGRHLALSVGFRVVKGKGKKPSKKPNLVGDIMVGGKKGARPVLSRIPELVKKVLPTAPSRESIKVLSKSKYTMIAVLVLILLILAFVALPEARVVIVTRSEPVTRDVEIQVDVSQGEADSATLVIPGTMVEREVEGSKSFTPTGRRNIGKKASGFVQIYNLSKSTLILKAETTTLTVSGRAYVFTQDVGGIRPTAFIGQGDDQEIDISSLVAPVPVVARNAGEQFNIPDATRIEIQNEVFGSKPDELYALAAGNVTGGSTLEVKVVTEVDVIQSLEAVKSDLISQAGKDLESENSGLKLLERAVRIEVIEESVSHQPGAQVSEFSAAAKIKIMALAYDQNDVLSVVKNRVERLLPQNKRLIPDEESTLESRFFVTNLDEGTAVLINHFESRIVYELDEADLKQKIAGKNSDEIKEILLSRPEIESVEVSFYPFWVRSAPRFINRISIEKQ